MKRLPEHLDFETINEIIHVQIIISLLSHQSPAGSTVQKISSLNLQTAKCLITQISFGIKPFKLAKYKLDKYKHGVT